MLNKDRVEKFIDSAMKYKGDRYSQPKRMQKGYSDCTSLVQKALSNIGLNTNNGLAVTTHRMGVEGDKRFKQIPMAQLQRGDILWGGAFENGKWSGHVAIYLGNGKTLESRVREGVDFNVKRPYFTRAYRVVALEEEATVQKGMSATYALLYVNGKQAKISPFIINGTAYVKVGNIDVPVRAFFEELGMAVKWSSGRIDVV